MNALSDGQGFGQSRHPVERARRPGAIDQYLAFRAELRDALRQGTAAAFRSCVRRWARRDPHLTALIAQPDQILQPFMKRMILEEAQLADLHEEARMWLVTHESSPIPTRTIAPTDGRRSPRFYAGAHRGSY
ncbi:MAG: hypothetical protein FJ033_04880 [Chloroflexi bacterium]|nr:hypothetical protein [Chloroflexota bacterium]